MASETWFLWAVLSAVFAALTAIFAKLGIQGVNADFATLIRTMIILVVLGAFVVALEVMHLSALQAVTVSFSALALAQVMHVFNMREPGTSLVRNAVTRNRFVWWATIICGGLVVVANAWPPLRGVLQLETLPPSGWVLVAVAALAPMAVGQVGKAMGLGRV